MKQSKASIVAMGGFVPEYILTNSELEQMVDTSDKMDQRKNRNFRTKNFERSKARNF